MLFWLIYELIIFDFIIEKNNKNYRFIECSGQFPQITNYALINNWKDHGRYIKTNWKQLKAQSIETRHIIINF